MLAFLIGAVCAALAVPLIAGVRSRASDGGGVPNAA
jgi:hypothetical protein